MSAEATRLTNQGWALIRRGDSAGAAKKFGELIRLTPNDPEAYVLRGLAYKHDDRDDLALADYATAIRVNPDYKPPYYDRADIYERLGNVQGAIDDYTQLIRIDPNSTEWYGKRAELYYKKGNNDGAIADYTKALSINKSASYYLWRGFAYHSKGEFDKAGDDYTNAIRLKPLDSDLMLAHHNRGKIWITVANKYKYKDNSILYGVYAGMAVRDYTEAINLDPGDPQKYSERADVYEMEGKKDLAAADRQKAAELKGKN